MIKEDILRIIYQELYAVETCYGDDYNLAIERVAERVIEEIEKDRQQLELGNVHNAQDS